jgi:phosphoglycolate phosphatase
MAPPALRSAIFDLDGTLVDTLGDFVVALNATLADLHLPAVGRSFIADTIGRGSEHLLRSTLAKVGGDAALYDEAWARYQHHYRSINGEYANLFDGVPEGLQALRARAMPLACLTNKPTAFARTLLARKGLDRYFDHVWGGDAFERRKPDPLPLLKACEALGTEPSATLVVGDSTNDARAARAAGCPVVLVTYGYNHGHPVRQEPADAFVDRLDELPLTGFRWPPAPGHC